MSQRDLQLSESLRIILDRFGRDLFVSMPGKVQKVNFADGSTTIDVQPLLFDTILDNSDNPEIQELQTITDIPVMSFRTANFFLHFPIEIGDNVILICLDRSINELVETSGESPISPRLTAIHQLTDCVAFPMSFSNLSPMPEMPAGEILLAHKDQSVELRIKDNGEVVLKGDKVFLGADAGTIAVADAIKTNSRLTALETHASSHVHATAATGPPVPGTPPFSAGGGDVSSAKVFMDS
jgi:hypothetical protein